MNIIAVYGAHDANICVNIDGKYRVYELERYTRIRYFELYNSNEYKQILDGVFSQIKKEFNIDKFDLCIYKNIPEEQRKYICDFWSISNFEKAGHHIEHAACAFYQSDFEESLIISYDGGGEEIDGSVNFFNIYIGDRDGIRLLKRLPYNLGAAYNVLAMPLLEVRKQVMKRYGTAALPFAGKKMGLVAYGEVADYIGNIRSFYKMATGYGPHSLKALNIAINGLSGKESYDFAATSQAAFEEIVLEEILPIIEEYGLPVCLTGGCALNVLLNEKLRKMIDLPVFVPPNPSDTGLSLGMISRKLNSKIEIPLTYSGFPILDIEKLDSYVLQHDGANKIGIKEICELLSQGKIIGILREDSEIGPRALGNRSIVCDPSFKDMKDILNSKVKFREWYRPFAPFVQRENCNKYFDFDNDSPYMSFCPIVREEWKEQLCSITHEDGTARVQTVTREQHAFFYDLLQHYSNMFGKEVLLNTSFNIKGLPILTTIADALRILKETEIDYVIVEDYIFGK